MVKIYLINPGKTGKDFIICENYLISGNSNSVHLEEHGTGIHYVIPLVNVALIEEGE